jgi:uncharacterized protein YfiM (DUF2279 family)
MDGESARARVLGSGPWAGPCEEGGRPATRAVVATSAVAGNVALLVYFKRAWWSGERADEFFFRTDWDQDFRDQDKLGHAFGGYHLTRAGVELLKLACVSPRKAVLVSAAYATLFQLQIEVWDGFFESYGFSYPDVVMNAAGAAFAVMHEVAPRSRAVTPTMWYEPTAAWHRREEHGGHPRATTDYSGQSYWLSVDVDTLLPPDARRFWPGLVRFSVGHSITDWVDAETGANIRARRRILLSLDLDASKLPGRHPAWVFAKRQLGHLRLPAPALQITPSVEGIAWYP